MGLAHFKHLQGLGTFLVVILLFLNSWYYSSPFIKHVNKNTAVSLSNSFLDTKFTSEEQLADGRSIDHSDQPLSVDIEQFWTSSKNKVKFQQFFIGWVSNTHKGEKPVHLGGCLISSLQCCVKFSQGTVEQFPS